MRSVRLTVFLWIILVLNIISAAPITIVIVDGVMSGIIDLTDILTSLYVFLAIAPSLFSIYLIIKMFQMEAWARNTYIAFTVLSWIMGLISGNFAVVIISVLIHIFVFWKSWDEFS